MSLSELLKVRYPLLQAPMAAANDSRMAIEVSRAGALGALPCALLSPERLREELAGIRAAGAGPVNVNFFCHTPPPADPAREAAWRERLDVYYRELGAADAPPGPGRSPIDEATWAIVEGFRPEVVSFHFGLPEPGLLARVRASGAKILASATTAAEARWLEQRGCDAIIAQGAEAGGHRGMFLDDDPSRQVGTFALVPQVVDAVKVPVIAAGGVMDARGIRAALALGASGVQLGTAYLFCPEATLTERHRQRLASATSDDTVITNVFSGRPARSFANRLVRELGPISPLAPAFPLASAALAPLKGGEEEFQPQWSGQGAPLGRSRGAYELTVELCRAFGA